MKTKLNKSVLLFFCLIFLNSEVIAQASGAGALSAAPNQPISAGNDFLGWDNTVNVPLMIRCKNSYGVGVDPSIQFWISTTKYMWIDGNTKNVAIGSAIATNPPYKLTVEANVDVKCQNTSTPPWTEGYRYNENLILCAPVSSQNIFVG
jgi:hypothetical protein